MINDIRNAPKESLSLQDAINDMMQLEHVMGKELQYDPYHIEVIKGTLTRHISTQLPDIHAEILEALAAELPEETEWKEVHAFRAIRKIVCRATNRAFVGAPLCHNPEYMDLNIKFAINVFLTAVIMNLIPGFMGFLKVAVAKWLSPSSRTINQAVKHLRPIIQERLDKEREYNGEWPGKPDDFLTWLMSEAQGNQLTIENLTLRILSVNFATIHTTSIVLVNCLYALAAHTEYIQPLREEVKGLVEEYGWTKTAISKMWKLDSFMKEAERTNGGSAVSMHRKALKEFTFSNGTSVPAGTILAVAVNAVHHDDAIYPNANNFNGYRFSSIREQQGESIKHQMSTPDLSWLLFGHGHHSCPGRFFAVNVLKLILASLILKYDIKFEREGEVPPNEWLSVNNMPNTSAKVLVRKVTLKGV
ncbi:hypothetical protein E1B28_009494 [Marasmius oreades]|uniref:Cytochrome P450 n=1 Tax=Marasmius oreades TaxID=181124 RepID=A0A9P7RVE5_9AGAR|nr:uncharacterized protein E1B28_009494 [Marasmius oreades]KAG7090375.1 hypothetical protein E1B28_009494 [Marasmius oreades]